MKLKYLMLTLISVFITQIARSQCNCSLSPSSGSILTENYNSNGSWIFTDNSAGTMTIAGGGTMSYGLPAGGAFNKASLSVPGLVANSQAFVAEGSVAINGGNSPGHFIMAFTENNTDPICDQAYTPTNNDGIFVSLVKAGGAPASGTCCTNPNQVGAEWQFVLGYKNGNVFNNSLTNNVINMLNPNPFSTYYVRLVRRNCRAYLAVYSNSAFTTHIPGSPVCIDIPNTVTNFGFLQQGVYTWASPDRTVAMNVDNIRVSPYTSGCTLTNGLTFFFGYPCPGENANLTVNGAPANSTYLWSNGATTQTTIVNQMVNTTYTVTVTSTFGCAQTDSQLITVNPNCTPVQFCRYINDGIVSATRDRGEAVIKTSDGGIALIGTLSQTTIDDDIYFVKYAPDMTPQCSLRLGDLVSGGTLRESGFAVMQASDGFYYVAGTVNVATGNTDIFVLKINLSNCNTTPIVWSQRFGENSFNESAIQIVEMPIAPSSYDLLVVGSATNAATSASDILAVKISSSGSYINSRVYYPVGTPTTSEYGRDAIRLINSTNKYIIVGDSREPTNNAIIISIDQNLVMGAFATIDGGKNESAQGLVERGSEIFVVGRSNQFTQDNDVAVFRMNASLTGPITGYTYGTSVSTTKEIGYGIKNTSTGNLIIAGSSYESTASNLNGLLLELNPATMGINWAKKTSQPGYYLYNDEFKDIVEISNGNFVVTGYTGLTASDEEIFIGKFDNLNGSLNECCLLNYPMTSNSYYHIGPSMDQKQISFQKNPHGISAYYYAELNTCSQFSSFRMTSEQVMQNSESSLQEIKVYPNPSEGIFSLKISGLLQETLMMRLFDSSGRLVMFDESLTGNSNVFEFNCRHLKEGIYFLEVITDSGKHRSKISIQK